jgi:3',5'-cyclic AMP phosphodiesterase CpdA
VRLVPYIPRCAECGAPSPRAFEVRERTERALARPEGAIRIGHLSDLHIGQRTSEHLDPLAWFRIWLERFREHEVDAVVVSGDLVHRPADREGLLGARAVLEESGLPWVVVPGNHDISRPGWSEVFHEIYGRYPRVETLAGVTFVLLDSMAGLPMAERELAEKLYGDVVCYTEGRIGRRQLAAADALLERSDDDHRVLVLHHHLTRQHPDPMFEAPLVGPVLDEDLFDTMKTLHDAEEVCQWAAARRVRVVLHGHKHLFQQPGVRDGGIVVLNGGSSTLERRKRARLVDMLSDGGMRVRNVELAI